MNEHENRWGGRLPHRGYRAAYLLCQASSPLQAPRMRNNDTADLAELLGIPFDQARRLANETRVAVGFSAIPKESWRQSAYHDWPGGEYPSAERWLAEAGLEYDGTWKDPA